MTGDWDAKEPAWKRGEEENRIKLCETDGRLYNLWNKSLS